MYMHVYTHATEYSYLSSPLGKMCSLSLWNSSAKYTLQKKLAVLSVNSENVEGGGEVGGGGGGYYSID